MTSRAHITGTPLTPEEAVRRIPDLIDSWPDEQTVGAEFARLARIRPWVIVICLSLFLAACGAAVLVGFGIL